MIELYSDDDQQNSSFNIALNPIIEFQQELKQSFENKGYNSDVIKIFVRQYGDIRANFKNTIIYCFLIFIFSLILFSLLFYFLHYIFFLIKYKNENDN